MDKLYSDVQVNLNTDWGLNFHSGKQFQHLLGSHLSPSKLIMLKSHVFGQGFNKSMPLEQNVREVHLWLYSIFTQFFHHCLVTQIYQTEVATNYLTNNQLREAVKILRIPFVKGTIFDFRPQTFCGISAMGVGGSPFTDGFCKNLSIIWSPN